MCMKKIFVWGLMVCCMSTLAFGWGLDQNVVVTNHLANQGKAFPFLVHPVVNYQPIRIYFQRLRAYTAEDRRLLTQPEEMTDLDFFLRQNGVLEPLNSPQFFTELKQAYNDWFSFATQELDLLNEFADVMATLGAGTIIQRTEDPFQANLIVIVADDVSVSKQACRHQFREDACLLQTSSFDELPYLVIADKLPAKTNRKWLLRYAAGISLGLAPQIAPKRTELGTQLQDPLHSTPVVRESLMGGSLEFTCDDLDGLINLIDITRYEQAESYPFRWYPFGWNSFCHDKTHYMAGIPTGKGPYFILKDADQQEEGHYLLTTIRDRKKTQRTFEPSRTETYTPFQSHKFRTVEKDSQDRPVHSVSKDGAEAFFMYHHGFEERLIVRGDEFLLMQSIRSTPNGSSTNKTSTRASFYKYVEGGKVKTLHVSVAPNYDRHVVYCDDADACADDESHVTASLTVRPLSDGKYEVIDEQPLPTPNLASAQPMDANSGYNQSMNITIALEKKTRTMNWEELREKMLFVAGVK